jgi:hypothetical protein
MSTAAHERPDGRGDDTPWTHRPAGTNLQRRAAGARGLIERVEVAAWV